MDNNGNKKFLYLSAFVVLVLAAFFVLISDIFPKIGLNISGTTISILQLIEEIALISAIAVGAFIFTKGKGTFIKVVYWVALGIYIVGVIWGKF
jgi:hypothetical protein